MRLGNREIQNDLDMPIPQNLIHCEHARHLKLQRLRPGLFQIQIRAGIKLKNWKRAAVREISAADRAATDKANPNPGSHPDALFFSPLEPSATGSHANSG